MLQALRIIGNLPSCYGNLLSNITYRLISAHSAWDLNFWRVCIYNAWLEALNRYYNYVCINYGWLKAVLLSNYLNVSNQCQEETEYVEYVLLNILLQSMTERFALGMESHCSISTFIKSSTKHRRCLERTHGEISVDTNVPLSHKLSSSPEHWQGTCAGVTRWCKISPSHSYDERKKNIKKLLHT